MVKKVENFSLKSRLLYPFNPDATNLPRVIRDLPKTEFELEKEKKMSEITPEFLKVKGQKACGFCLAEKGNADDEQKNRHEIEETVLN